MRNPGDNEDISNLSAIENNKVMQDLSEEIFHDFKNILATISGLAQLSMIKTQSDEVKDYLSHINKATFDFKDTLEKFYSFTGCDKSTEFMPYLLKDILEKALEMIKYKLNKPNLNNHMILLVLDLESDSLVVCNEYEVKQSLLNIMMNALDAMEEDGGTLSIELKDDDSFVVVNIIDTGIGIPEENLLRIFESKFTTKEYGTGLGLKISKCIMERLGGSLNVTSEVNRGTKVEMRFPKYKMNK